MQQTPVHERHNPDLLRFIPETSMRLIEIGCSSGALAREYRKVQSGCDYYGVDIDPAYIDLARRHCDDAAAFDIEQAGDDFFDRHADRDCWIFGDTLEHLRDPWRVLRRIRARMPQHGAVVACIPNAQHWSLQARLSVGDFRYADSGLFDRTHLRWFTRQTILELFESVGMRVADGAPRIFPAEGQERMLPLIGQLAVAAGGDAQQAMADALPLQYVVRAVPV